MMKKKVVSVLLVIFLRLFFIKKVNGVKFDFMFFFQCPAFHTCQKSAFSTNDFTHKIALNVGRKLA